MHLRFNHKLYFEIYSCFLHHILCIIFLCANDKLVITVVLFKIDKYFKLVSHAFLQFHRLLIIKAGKIFVILHSALCDTLTREFLWKKQSENRKEWKLHKLECQWHVFIYWVSVTAVLEGSFPNFNLTCKENSVHYSLLIDILSKVEMQVKR